MFLDPSASRKLLNVKIIDDEEYEKNKTFLIVLEEPILLEVGHRHGELSTQLQSLFCDLKHIVVLFISNYSS